MSYNELSEQEQLRRNSLAALRELGIEPYPAAEYPVTATAAEIAADFDPEKGNFQQVSIAGRIMGSETSALRNIVLGILGSFVGGILFGLVGLSATGLVGEIIVSVIGACVCIWAGRKLFK